MNTITVEVQLQNGTKTTINFEGNQQEFKDVMAFSNDSTYLQTSEDYFILTRSISMFKFKQGAN